VRFYDAVAAHAFARAAALWSPSMRQRYPPATYIDHRFANRPDGRRHGGQSARGRLHQALRHAFVAVRRQHGDVEAREPRGPDHALPA